MSPSSGVLYPSLLATTISNSSLSQNYHAAIYAPTSSANTLLLAENYFAATGLGAIALGSGGSLSGSGTCSLTAFNNGTGATATVTISGGSWSGATFAVTNTGYGATSAPTSATLGNGTATCSGTATLSTVLGGAQGTALRLIWFSAKQQ
jgi:hypothetical protein